MARKMTVSEYAAQGASQLRLLNAMSPADQAAFLAMTDAATKGAPIPASREEIRRLYGQEA